MKSLAPVMVDYTPDAKLVNAFIKAHQARTNMGEDAQVLATEWASQIASVAFFLYGSNDPARVEALLGSIVSEATGQFVAHKKAVEARANTHPAPANSQ